MGSVPTREWDMRLGGAELPSEWQIFAELPSSVRCHRWIPSMGHCMHHEHILARARIYTHVDAPLPVSIETE